MWPRTAPCRGRRRAEGLEYTPVVVGPEILIAGDRAHRGELVPRVQDLGYTVSPVRERELVARAAQSPSPAAVIVCLGDADAGGLVGALRQSPETTAIPVLLYGRLQGETRDLAAVLELGADRFLEAPVDEAELKAALAELAGPPEAVPRTEARTEPSPASRPSRSDPALSRLHHTLAELAARLETREESIDNHRDGIDLEAMGLDAVPDVDPEHDSGELELLREPTQRLPPRTPSREAPSSRNPEESSPRAGRRLTRSELTFSRAGEISPETRPHEALEADEHTASIATAAREDVRKDRVTRGDRGPQARAGSAGDEGELSRGTWSKGPVGPAGRERASEAPTRRPWSVEEGGADSEQDDGLSQATGPEGQVRSEPTVSLARRGARSLATSEGRGPQLSSGAGLEGQASDDETARLRRPRESSEERAGDEGRSRAPAEAAGARRARPGRFEARAGEGSERSQEGGSQGQVGRAAGSGAAAADEGTVELPHRRWARHPLAGRPETGSGRETWPKRQVSEDLDAEAEAGPRPTPGREAAPQGRDRWRGARGEGASGESEESLAAERRGRRGEVDPRRGLRADEGVGFAEPSRGSGAREATEDLSRGTQRRSGELSRETGGRALEAGGDLPAATGRRISGARDGGEKLSRGAGSRRGAEELSRGARFGGELAEDELSRETGSRRTAEGLARGARFGGALAEDGLSRETGRSHGAGSGGALAEGEKLSRETGVRRGADELSRGTGGRRGAEGLAGVVGARAEGSRGDATTRLGRQVERRLSPGTAEQEGLAPLGAGTSSGETDAPALLAELRRERFTGCLQVDGSEAPERRLWWSEGQVIGGASTATGESVLGRLMARGLLSAAHLELVARWGSGDPRRDVERLAQSGLIKPQEMREALREPVRRIVERIAEAGRVAWTLHPGAAPATAVELGVPLAAMIAGGVQRGTTLAELRAAVSDARRPRLAFAGPEALAAELRWPAVAAVTERFDGQTSVGELIAEAVADEAVIRGAVHVLELLGHLAPELDDPAASLTLLDRQRVRERLRLARESDYFALLGLPREASRAEVLRAHADLTSTFCEGLEPDSRVELAEEIEELLAALDEARDVLADDALHSAYLAQIGAV